MINNQINTNLFSSFDSKLNLSDVFNESDRILNGVKTIVVGTLLCAPFSNATDVSPISTGSIDLKSIRNSPINDLTLINQFSTDQRIKQLIEDRCNLRCSLNKNRDTHTCIDKCAKIDHYSKMALNQDLDIESFYNKLISEEDNGTFEEKLVYSLRKIKFANESDTEISLILEADSNTDYNGALDVINQLFYQKLSLKSPIIFNTVKSSNNLYDTIRKTAEMGYIIKYLIIKGHGNAQAIALGNNPKANADNFFCADQNRMSTMQKYLSEEAYIVFDSCLSGMGESKKNNNLVNVMSRALPGKTIIGANSFSTHLKIDSKGNIRIIDLFLDVTYSKKSEGIHLWDSFLYYLKPYEYLNCSTYS